MTGAETLTGPGGPLAPTTPEPGSTPDLAQDSAGTVYLIQEQVAWDKGNVGGRDGWRDVGTVTVPKRSSLKTVLEMALEELQGLKPTEASGPRLLRAIQPADIAEWEAVLEVPPAPAAQVVVRPAS